MDFQYYYIRKDMITLDGGKKTLFEKLEALDIPFIFLHDTICIDGIIYCFFKIPVSDYIYKFNYYEILRTNFVIPFAIPFVKHA